MELSLKVELTDEQYKDLMDKSFDAIMDREEVKEELKNIIIRDMQERIHTWVEANAQSWIRYVYGIGTGYYDSRPSEEEFVKKLIKDAGSEYTEYMSETVKKTMSDMVQTVNVEQIIYGILMDYIVKGVTGGFETWASVVNANSSIIRSNFNNLREYLKYNIHTDPPIEDTLTTYLSK